MIFRLPRRLAVWRQRWSLILSFVAVINFAFPHPALGRMSAEPSFDASQTTCLDVPADFTVPGPVNRLPEVERRPAKRVIRLTVTAYSSTVDQTDADPFTTASGSRVRDGIIAYNYLPFGTRIRFPDIFGDKVFVVQDRLNARAGQYLADIWMTSREQANQWGHKVLRMEVL